MHYRKKNNIFLQSIKPGEDYLPPLSLAFIFEKEEKGETLLMLLQTVVLFTSHYPHRLWPLHNCCWCPSWKQCISLSLLICLWEFKLN